MKQRDKSILSFSGTLTELLLAASKLKEDPVCGFEFLIHLDSSTLAEMSKSFWTWVWAFSVLCPSYSVELKLLEAIIFVDSANHIYKQVPVKEESKDKDREKDIHIYSCMDSSLYIKSIPACPENIAQLSLLKPPFSINIISYKLQDSSKNPSTPCIILFHPIEKYASQSALETFNHRGILENAWSLKVLSNELLFSQYALYKQAHSFHGNLNEDNVILKDNRATIGDPLLAQPILNLQTLPARRPTKPASLKISSSIGSGYQVFQFGGKSQSESGISFTLGKGNPPNPNLSPSFSSLPEADLDASKRAQPALLLPENESLLDSSIDAKEQKDLQNGKELQDMQHRSTDYYDIASLVFNRCTAQAITSSFFDREDLIYLIENNENKIKESFRYCKDEEFQNFILDLFLLQRKESDFYSVTKKHPFYPLYRSTALLLRMTTKDIILSHEKLMTYVLLSADPDNKMQSQNYDKHRLINTLMLSVEQGCVVLDSLKTSYSGMIGIMNDTASPASHWTPWEIDYLFNLGMEKESYGYEQNEERIDFDRFFLLCESVKKARKKFALVSTDLSINYFHYIDYLANDKEWKENNHLPNLHRRISTRFRMFSFIYKRLKETLDASNGALHTKINLQLSWIAFLELIITTNIIIDKHYDAEVLIAKLDVVYKSVLQLLTSTDIAGTSMTYGVWKVLDTTMITKELRDKILTAFDFDVHSSDVLNGKNFHYKIGEELQKLSTCATKVMEKGPEAQRSNSFSLSLPLFSFGLPQVSPVVSNELLAPLECMENVFANKKLGEISKGGLTESILEVNKTLNKSFSHIIADISKYVGLIHDRGERVRDSEWLLDSYLHVQELPIQDIFDDFLTSKAQNVLNTSNNFDLLALGDDIPENNATILGLERKQKLMLNELSMREKNTLVAAGSLLQVERDESITVNWENMQNFLLKDEQNSIPIDKLYLPQFTHDTLEEEKRNYIQQKKTQMEKVKLLRAHIVKSRPPIKKNIDAQKEKENKVHGLRERTKKDLSIEIEDENGSMQKTNKNQHEEDKESKKSQEPLIPIKYYLEILIKTMEIASKHLITPLATELNTIGTPRLPLIYKLGFDDILKRKKFFAAHELLSKHSRPASAAEGRPREVNINDLENQISQTIDENSVQPTRTEVEEEITEASVVVEENPIERNRVRISNPVISSLLSWAEKYTRTHQFLEREQKRKIFEMDGKDMCNHQYCTNLKTAYEKWSTSRVTSSVYSCFFSGKENYSKKFQQIVQQKCGNLETNVVSSALKITSCVYQNLQEVLNTNPSFVSSPTVLTRQIKKDLQLTPVAFEQLSNDLSKKFRDIQYKYSSFENYVLMQNQKPNFLQSLSPLTQKPKSISSLLFPEQIPSNFDAQNSLSTKPILHPLLGSEPSVNMPNFTLEPMNHAQQQLVLYLRSLRPSVMFSEQMLSSPHYSLPLMPSPRNQASAALSQSSRNIDGHMTSHPSLQPTPTSFFQFERLQNQNSSLRHSSILPNSSARPNLTPLGTNAGPFPPQYQPSSERYLPTYPLHTERAPSNYGLGRERSSAVSEEGDENHQPSETANTGCLPTTFNAGNDRTPFDNSESITYREGCNLNSRQSSQSEIFLVPTSQERKDSLRTNNTSLHISALSPQQRNHEEANNFNGRALRLPQRSSMIVPGTESPRMNEETNEFSGFLDEHIENQEIGNDLRFELQIPEQSEITTEVRINANDNSPVGNNPMQAFLSTIENKTDTVPFYENSMEPQGGILDSSKGIKKKSKEVLRDTTNSNHAKAKEKTVGGKKSNMRG